MTEKRFDIIKSAIIDGARVIKDNENKYTFATTFETATLINYRKALNELNDENEQLKQEIIAIEKRADKVYDKNEQLKQELSEYKDYVFSDTGILCYTCVNCLKKGIYKVECSEKGKVDVHSSCLIYWRKEVE